MNMLLKFPDQFQCWSPAHHNVRIWYSIQKPFIVMFIYFDIWNFDLVLLRISAPIFTGKLSYLATAQKLNYVTTSYFVTHILVLEAIYGVFSFSHAIYLVFEHQIRYIIRNIRDSLNFPSDLLCYIQWKRNPKILFALKKRQVGYTRLNWK